MVRGGPDPPQLEFEIQQELEDRACREAGRGDQRAVQKQRLVRHADWRGLHERGDLNVRQRRPQRFDGTSQIPLPITQVATERNRDAYG
jgi:hypothetical protein